MVALIRDTSRLDRLRGNTGPLSQSKKGHFSRTSDTAFRLCWEAEKVEMRAKASRDCAGLDGCDAIPMSG